jgi:hypothetical protein
MLKPPQLSDNSIRICRVDNASPGDGADTLDFRDDVAQRLYFGARRREGPAPCCMHDRIPHVRANRYALPFRGGTDGRILGSADAELQGRLSLAFVAHGGSGGSTGGHTPPWRAVKARWRGLPRHRWISSLFLFVSFRQLIADQYLLDPAPFVVFDENFSFVVQGDGVEILHRAVIETAALHRPDRFGVEQDFVATTAVGLTLRQAVGLLRFVYPMICVDTEQKHFRHLLSVWEAPSVECFLVAKKPVFISLLAPF